MEELHNYDAYLNFPDDTIKNIALKLKIAQDAFNNAITPEETEASIYRISGLELILRAELIQYKEAQLMKTKEVEAPNNIVNLATRRQITK
jgi:hypothetical protein